MAFTLTLSTMVGCDKAEGAQKGSVGESCQKRDDCGGGLSCIENRCVNEDSDTGGDGGTERVAGGKIGESCTRRGDCQAGLACFGQTCTNDTLATDAGAVADTRGDRGESCAARNDCRPGLACVAGSCRQSEVELSTQAKHCFRVDCMTTEDCCADFKPTVFTPAQCAVYKSDCDLAGGSPSVTACNYYRNYCTCRQTCQASQCVTGGCLADTDCALSGTPYCVEASCKECRTTADCAAEPGTQCDKGACRAPCTRNEECPTFFACQAGACVDVGCTSDRECAFDTKVPRAKCVNKVCKTPCKSDAECASVQRPFDVCENEVCVFVGCESNEECRAYLGLELRTDKATAVCKMPDPM